MRSDRSSIIYSNEIPCTFPLDFYHSSHGDMPLHVQREMVRAREGPLTQPALERPVPGVLAVVASQLVRAGELPAATFPAALVRLLARVRAEMRLQVRRFGVRLAARRVRTSVRGQLLTPTTSASSLRFLLYFARYRDSAKEGRMWRRLMLGGQQVCQVG